MINLWVDPDGASASVDSGRRLERKAATPSPPLCWLEYLLVAIG